MHLFTRPYFTPGMRSPIHCSILPFFYLDCTYWSLHYKYFRTTMSCNSLLANVVCFTCTTLNKALSYLILSYLICNMSLTEGVFPDNRQVANVIPLYKSEDPMYYNNYRPVSLLCILSIAFEKIMFDSLLNFVKRFDLIYTRQYGQAIIWTNAAAIQWRIYAALVGDGLKWLPHLPGTTDLAHFELKKWSRKWLSFGKICLLFIRM